MKMASLIAVAFLASGFRADACELATALASWKNGDIEDALACAERVEPSGSAEADRKSFLLMGIAFAKGQYPESIRIYRTLSRDFFRIQGSDHTCGPGGAPPA
jgi:hypothetical protein